MASSSPVGVAAGLMLQPAADFFSDKHGKNPNAVSIFDKVGTKKVKKHEVFFIF